MQFTGSYVARITQSPVGRQNDAKAWNVDHPPLAGHPNDPPFSPHSQFFAGLASPELSTTGNALQHVGGPEKHGFCVCWLWCSIRYAMENVCDPSSLMKICSGSPGSTENCTSTPAVPG